MGIGIKQGGRIENWISVFEKTKNIQNIPGILIDAMSGAAARTGVEINKMYKIQIKKRGFRDCRKPPTKRNSGQLDIDIGIIGVRDVQEI